MKNQLNQQLVTGKKEEKFWLKNDLEGNNIQNILKPLPPPKRKRKETKQNDVVVVY